MTQDEQYRHDIEVKQKTWTSAGQASYAMLQYTGKKSLSLSEVMGYTTHAFRINIHPRTVSPAGPTMFDPYELVSKGLRTMGLRTLTVNEEAPVAPDQLADILSSIQSGVDTGVPVIAWNLFAPEFGLIYGYDHEKQVVYAKDLEKDGKIAYEKLNERNHLYFCRYFDIQDKHKVTILREALLRIIEHAQGHSPFSSPDYMHGVEAYQAWIRAFQGAELDVVGNAYNAQVVADARYHAEQFLKKLSNEWEQATDLDKIVKETLRAAHQSYQLVAETMQQFAVQFPFPDGGEPQKPEIKLKSIELLQRAYLAEVEGVNHLKALYQLIKEYNINEHLQCKILEKDLQFTGMRHVGVTDKLEQEIIAAKKQFAPMVESISTRTINIDATLITPRKKQDQLDTIFYVTMHAHTKMRELPHGMVHLHEKGRYAVINGRPSQRKEMYERLNHWIDEQGIKRHPEANTLEVYGPDPLIGRILELHIPILDA